VPGNRDQTGKTSSSWHARSEWVVALAQAEHGDLVGPVLSILAVIVFVDTIEVRIFVDAVVAVRARMS
jgi:hypothetical protein